MSLLDEDVLVNDNEPIRKSLVKTEFENHIAVDLLSEISAKCIIVEEEDINSLTKKIAEANKININTTIPFATRLKSLIENATPSSELKEHSNREIFSLDCHKLCKGDAYGWLQWLQCHMEQSRRNNPIVIINNVTQVPDGDRNFYDDPVYVTNLLLRSWKNEDIYAGDIHIDCRNMTIILTAPPQDKDFLLKECGWNSYYWIGDFNEWEKETYELAEKIVNDKWNL